MDEEKEIPAIEEAKRNPVNIIGEIDLSNMKPFCDCENPKVKFSLYQTMCENCGKTEFANFIDMSTDTLTNPALLMVGLLEDGRPTSGKLSSYQLDGHLITMPDEDFEIVKKTIDLSLSIIEKQRKDFKDRTIK